MDENHKEIMEVALTGRTLIYTLLHKVFGMEPDENLLQSLSSDEVGSAFALFSSEEGDTLQKAETFLKDIKKRYDILNPGFLEAVKNEYTHLFVGPAKLIAPPWESIYRGKESMLFSADTLAVREFYRNYHLLPQEYPHVADDSLALEMAFMEALAERAQNAFTAGDEVKMKYNLTGADIFLQAHLLVWIPKFMERMKHSPSDFLYPQMCLIMSEFIQKDHELLSNVLKTVRL